MKRNGKSVLSLIICMSLILTGCAASPRVDPAQEQDTKTMIDLRCQDISLDANRAGIKIGDVPVNTVNALIFGDNISYRGEGYGIWNVETDAPDETLLSMLKASGITHLRYPGGCEGDYFHWYESVGEVRKEQVDPFSHEYPTYAAKRGEGYLPLFGFDEFMKLCEAADIRATVQLNVSTGTPQEAVDWIHYAESKGYDVASWCLGNESHFKSDPVEGVSCCTTPEQYVSFCLEFFSLLGEEADALNIGVEALPASHPLGQYKDWDKIVLTALADRIDFVDVHIGYTYYFSSGEDDKTAAGAYMAGADWVKALLEEEKDNIRRFCPERADEIEIQMTEYGPIGGTHANSLSGALFLASFFNLVLSEPEVTAANHLPMLNHYGAPNLLGALTDLSVCGEKVYWDNVSTYVFRMYSAMSGRQVLPADITGCSTFRSAAVGLQPELRGVKMADAACFYDEESGEGTIFLINRNTDMNTGFDLSLPFERLTVTGITELWNESPVAKNTYSNTSLVLPHIIDDYNGTICNGTFSVVSKPISLLKIDFTAR